MHSNVNNYIPSISTAKLFAPSQILSPPKKKIVDDLMPDSMYVERSKIYFTNKGKLARLQSRDRFQRERLGTAFPKLF